MYLIVSGMFCSISVGVCVCVCVFSSGWEAVYLVYMFSFVPEVWC